MPSFKEQVISSSKWAFINQLVTQVIRLAVSVYLMRLLAPESFGVFMKVLSVIGISEVLVGLRLGGGIVQSQSTTKQQISTIFWVTFTGSVLLAAIFYLAAGFIANFYDDPRLESITKLLSFVLIIMGIGYVPRSLLTKELRFKEMFYANLAGITLSSVVGIWMALNNYDYWSLVWQWAIFNSVIAISFTLLSSMRIYFSMNLISVKNIWDFSKKIVMDDSLNYGARNIDNILVGKFLGANQLGFYSRAYGLMLLPLQNFVNIIRGVLFPAFSKIQNDKNKISKIFFLSTQSISFLLQPFFLYTIIYSDELVSTVLGEQWLPISPLLKIFLLLALIQSHTTLISSVFLSLGRTDILLKISYITKPIIFLAMFISVQFGLMPLVVSIVILNSIPSIVALHYGLALINSSLLDYLKNILPIIKINGFIYGLCLLQYHYFPLEIYGLLTLVSILALSLIIYLLFFEKMKPEFYSKLKTEFLNI